MHTNSVQVHSDPALLLKPFFEKHTYSKVAVLTDENTRTLCYDRIREFLPSHAVITVAAGESFKNLDTCQQIWLEMTNQHLDRHSLLLVIGGGVLGDMGGFCAATYKRGIDFVLMPTTLLAQVDASVGGKLAIDFQGYKNHIGVFQLPVTTLICPSFLDSLSFREVRSGFAEIIKHCIISDAAMWDTIRTKDVNGQDWEPLIRHSVAFKTQVVTEDPREKGRRKVLNFGHTIGHALETYFLDSPDRLFHGEAIAAGMIAETYLAHRKGLMTEVQQNQVVQYLKQVYGKTKPAPGDSIIAIIKQDKKNKGNKVLMALPEGIGNAVWDIEISETEIVEALSFLERIQATI